MERCLLKPGFIHELSSNSVRLSFWELLHTPVVLSVLFSYKHVAQFTPFTEDQMIPVHVAVEEENILPSFSTWRDQETQGFQ